MRTRATPERFCGGDSLRRGAISSVSLCNRKRVKLTQNACSEQISRYKHSVFNKRVFIILVCALLFFKGRVGGPLHNKGGSVANFLCLHNEPQWENVNPGHQGSTGSIWGTSYALVTGATQVFSYANNGGISLKMKPAPCAVCDVPGRTRSIMIPARKDCPSGWTREYSGYLAGELQNAERRRSTAICVDEAPETTTGTDEDYESVLHPVEARCGTLPCTTYTDGNELTCVVCSK